MRGTRILSGFPPPAWRGMGCRPPVQAVAERSQCRGRFSRRTVSEGLFRSRRWLMRWFADRLHIPCQAGCDICLARTTVALVDDLREKHIRPGGSWPEPVPDLRIHGFARTDPGQRFAWSSAGVRGAPASKIDSNPAGSRAHDLPSWQVGGGRVRSSHSSAKPSADRCAD